MNEWLLKIVSLVFTVMTPELRTGIVAYIKRLESDVKKTPNPWDDIFVDILKSILNIKD